METIPTRPGTTNTRYRFEDAAARARKALPLGGAFRLSRRCESESMALRQRIPQERKRGRLSL